MSRSGLDGDFNNVAPRVGVSWDLTGRGTLVLRGGYGLFYDSGTLIENSALYFNPPYFALQLFFPSEHGADLLAAIRFPTGAGFPPRRPINTIDPRLPHRATRSRASLGLERAFIGDDADGALRRRRTATATGAQAQHQSADAGAGRHRDRAGRSRATATSCSSSRRRRRATTRCS